MNLVPDGDERELIGEPPNTSPPALIDAEDQNNQCYVSLSRPPSDIFVGTSRMIFNLFL